MAKAIIQLLIRTYLPFFGLTSFWYLLTLTIIRLGFELATFYYVIIIMIAANTYYIIESWLSVSSTSKRALIDVLINLTLLLFAFLTLALFLGERISLNSSLVLAALWSFLHPVLTDIPHIKRFFRTSVAVVAPYVCIPIDWTLTLLAILAYSQNR